MVGPKQNVSSQTFHTMFELTYSVHVYAGRHRTETCVVRTTIIRRSAFVKMYWTKKYLQIQEKGKGEAENRVLKISRFCVASLCSSELFFLF